MTEEQRIHNIAEKRVKEWIEYAKKEYGWENAQYDLFEEPMFELCVQVATLATKELQEENERLVKHILELQADKGRLTDELTKKSNTNHQFVEQLAEQNEQLIEAKEIIRELVRAVEHSYSVLNWQRPPIIKDKAEVFLKE